jgi:hypothetical protein
VERCSIDWEVAHMEPMVIVALGIVVYSMYLTAKDLLADLRAEGMLRKPTPGRTLATMSFFSNEGKPQRSWRPDPVFALVPCRGLWYSRPRPAPAQVHRMCQR